jgi:lipoyl synthase
MRSLLSRYGLHTVCQEAQCPNAPECWSARTATFLVLGDTCTRHCRYCDVPTGDPGGVVDHQEPVRVAEAVRELGLQYVVLTSVDRDDLPDGGADAFARVVERLVNVPEPPTVELLMPDFSGKRSSLDRMLGAGADVLGHNVETVRRLTPRLRDRRAGYDQSLAVLEHLAQHAGSRRVKSGLMVGLGESMDDIVDTLGDLRRAGVSMLTIGQYLQPSRQAAPVARYVTLGEFEQMETCAIELGFSAVVAGPMVRSSYHAAAAFAQA